MGLPEGFRVGVATAGFQIEGGFNGRDEPANNWAEWERRRKVAASGSALRFWSNPEPLLDRAHSLGCTSFRMSVEWARCEQESGTFDRDAFAGYQRILQACRDRDMVPMVTIHHFTHPAWLGVDFWLDIDSPERFTSWARRVVDELGALCEEWVTINEPNVYALHSYVTGMFPPGKRGATGFAIRALDNLIAAHALAYRAIKAVQPRSSIATNTYAFTAYELDRLLIDLLLHRSRGVTRRDLHGHLVERRSAWHAAFPARAFAERAVRRVTASGIPLEQAFPRSQAAIEGGPDRPLDAIQVDYYDPVVSHHLRLPGHRTAGGRNWLPGRMLWDDPPDPDALTRYCRAAAEPGLPLQVVENGLCNRVVGSTCHPRGDGWTRPRYLRENLAALRGAIEAGVDITGYWHWTLADNYEWGSYEPRFGIFGVERSDPAAPVIGDLDAMGHDSAAAFRDAFTTEAAR